MNTNDVFRREMVKLHHPRWSKAEIEAYFAWRDSNEPRLRDHLWRLWLTLRGKSHHCYHCGRTGEPECSAWSKAEIEAYFAWRDSNETRLRDHLWRLWLTLRGKCHHCYHCGRTGECLHE